MVIYTQPSDRKKGQSLNAHLVKSITAGQVQPPLSLAMEKASCHSGLTTGTCKQPDKVTEMKTLRSEAASLF